MAYRSSCGRKRKVVRGGICMRFRDLLLRSCVSAVFFHGYDSKPTLAVNTN